MSSIASQLEPMLRREVSNSQTRDINNSSMMIADLQLAINPSLNSVAAGAGQMKG